MSNSRDYYDALAKSYQDVSNARSNYLAAVDLLVAKSIHTASPKKLLDIGSGDGRRILKLTEGNNVEVWALENSSEMCAILSKSIPRSHILETDISCISDIPETFDAVTALWNVFGHKEEIDTVFIDVRKKLSPGGLFIFDVNNPFNVAEYGFLPTVRNWWKSHLRHELLVFNLKQDDAKTDVYFRPLNVYKSLLTSAGFSRIRVKFIHYSSGRPTSRFRGQLYFECTSC